MVDVRRQELSVQPRHQRLTLPDILPSTTTLAAADLSKRCSHAMLPLSRSTAKRKVCASKCSRTVRAGGRAGCEDVPVASTLLARLTVTRLLP